MTPRITIIIPTYNRGDTLLRAVNSIIHQTYQDWELLVVDDGSTDNTEAVLEGLHHPRITYERLKENRGACYARNHGILQARGELIAFQDSDDFWKPEKLEKQIAFMENGKYDFVYSAMDMCGLHGKHMVVPQNHDSLPEHQSRMETYFALLLGNTSSTQTMLCKREAAVNTLFDTSLPRLQDWDFVLRIAKDYTIGFQNETLVEQYIQQNSISVKPHKLFEAFSILHEKYQKDIGSDSSIERSFQGKLAVSAFYAGYPCTKRFLKLFFKEYNWKYLAYAILSLTGLRKPFINFKRRRSQT